MNCGNICIMFTAKNNRLSKFSLGWKIKMAELGQRDAGRLLRINQSIKIQISRKDGYVMEYYYTGHCRSAIHILLVLLDNRYVK